jgi:hypothetical protein
LECIAYRRGVAWWRSKNAVTKHSYGSSNIWLPICNSTRTRPGWVEPEIYFRIVHLSHVVHPGAPVVAYREQTVEIALDPKGAFDSGNIGALMRRVATDQVVNVLPRRKGTPMPPLEPDTPRVVKLLRKAVEWQGLLKHVKIANQAEIARRKGISRGG